MVLQLNLKPLILKKFFEQYRASNPEWFKQYKVGSSTIAEHFSPELIQFLKESLEKQVAAPEGWMSANKLATKIGTKHENIKKMAEEFRSAHTEWFKNYRAGNNYVEHYSPELSQILREKFSV